MPVPAENLDLAEKLFLTYFRKNVEKFGPTYATYTNHNSLHFIQDLRNFGCEGDRSSTYDFETHHQMYRTLIVPGPKPHIQIRYV
jgi:hypothetical protein